MMSSNSPIAPPPRFQLYLAKKSLNKGIVYKGKEGVVVGKSEYIGSIAQDLVIGLVRAPLNEVPGRATLTTSTKPELVRQETSLPPPPPFPPRTLFPSPSSSLFRKDAALLLVCQNSPGSLYNQLGLSLPPTLALYIFPSSPITQPPRLTLPHPPPNFLMKLVSSPSFSTRVYIHSLPRYARHSLRRLIKRIRAAAAAGPPSPLFHSVTGGPPTQ